MSYNPYNQAPAAEAGYNYSQPYGQQVRAAWRHLLALFGSRGHHQSAVASDPDCGAVAANQGDKARSEKIRSMGS